MYIAVNVIVHYSNKQTSIVEIDFLKSCWKIIKNNQPNEICKLNYIFQKNFIQKRIFRIFDGVKVEIMQYLEQNLCAIRPKAIVQVAAIIVMTSVLVTHMVLFYNIDIA